MEESGEKSIVDPSYTKDDFREGLFGGPLRWLASVLAVVAVGFLIWLLRDIENASIRVIFRLKGYAAVGVIAVAAIFWIVVAVVSWNNWSKRQNLTSDDL